MPSPAVHSVHIYDEPAALITRLCGLVSGSLLVGDSVLLVTTAEHRDQLMKELTACGVDVRPHARQGRFVMLDAKELLSTFIRDGMPDRDLFFATVGKVLSEARKSSKSVASGLTVFGEMVAVLWDSGNKRAALQLEALWNDALNDRAFHLHCAYPRAGFVGGEETHVCAVHSHVLM